MDGFPWERLFEFLQVCFLAWIGAEARNVRRNGRPRS